MRGQYLSTCLSPAGEERERERERQRDDITPMNDKVHRGRKAHAAKLKLRGVSRVSGIHSRI